MEQQFLIDGIKCSACAAKIEKVLSSQEGVLKVNLVVAKNVLTVAFDETKLNSDKIIETVENLGYKATIRKALSLKLDTQNLRAYKLLALFIVFLLEMLISMGHLVNLKLIENAQGNALAQLFLTLLAIFICKATFVKAYKGLKTLQANMDTLVSVGVLASFTYSLFSVFTLEKSDLALVLHSSKYVFFEGCVGILFFVSIGKFIENNLKLKSTNALDALYNLVPKYAFIKQGNKVVETALENLKVKDVLCVKQGQAIVADGVVVSGDALVDESTMTGESLLVTKTKGSKVFSSTVVSQGYLEVEVSKLFEQSYLGSIIKAVEHAISYKLPIVRLTDKIASIFVPVVLSLSVLTFVYWYIFEALSFFEALKFAISVIVISCPCALGLATPMAISAGVYKAASLGILFKTPKAIEYLVNADTFVFDKTNTLTDKHMHTDKVEIFDSNYSKDMILKLVKSLELPSLHPIANALLENTKDYTSYEVSAFENLEHLGVSGIVKDTTYYLGSPLISEKLNLDYSESTKNLINKAQAKGQYVIALFDKQHLIALITLTTRVKTYSEALISELKKLGKRVLMLTGDSFLSTKTVAQKLQIEEYYANQSPFDKAKVIKQLQEKHHQVLMIGDGVNDSVAMSSADLSLSVKDSSDVAIKNTDIVLLKDDLFNILNAYLLSKATVKNIKENLFFAFFYNMLMIPVAAGALYNSYHLSLNPVLCSALMAISSLCVVGNAFRLSRFKAKKNTDGTAGLNPQLQYQLAIDGMHCKHCANSVKECLSKIDKVQAVTVDLGQGKAFIKANATLDVALIKDAITSSGFTFIGMTKID